MLCLEMSSFKSFLYLLIDYQNDSKELVKCSRFSKRDLSDKSNQNDFTSFCKRRISDEIQNELTGLVEESKIKKWEILIHSYHIDKNKMFLKLVRSSLTRAVLVEISETQSAFGSTNMFNDKTYKVYCSGDGESLTCLRMTTAARVVESLIISGNGTVTKAPLTDLKTVCLSSSNATWLRHSNDHLILVSKAIMSCTPDVSEEEYKLLRREDVLAMGNHKGVSELSVNKILDATVIFDMLSVKLEKSTVLDSSSQPKSARKSNCKGALFVLYNYARMCAILEKYAHCVNKAIYQPLPPTQNVDYNLLSHEDEWGLVFDFLVEWPAVIADCQNLDQPKLHRIISFLSALSLTFSVYYRHTRVLNEGLAHMIPVMEARVHLLSAIKQVFLNAFTILGIDAPTVM